MGRSKRMNRGFAALRVRRIGTAFLTAVALAALTTGCITLDPTAVEEARAAVRSAQTDPAVAPSSLDLEEAARHLAEAEDALGGRFQALADHEAYMATAHATIAQVAGEARLAQEATSAYLARAVRDTSRTQMQVASAVRRARALDAQQTDRGLVLTLGGVLFGFDSADLKPEAQTSVARVAGFLIALEDRSVLIEGFTDNVGDSQYNLGLSLRRAESVLEALVASHVPASRIVADGFGAAFPAADNETEEGRTRNRRVEIIILEPGRSLIQARRTRPLPGIATGPPE